MTKYLVFIDESGDHNLNKHSLDGQYNVFVLVAVVFETGSYQLFDEKFRTFKQKFRGDDKFVLHTAEITRPSRFKDERNLKFNTPEFRRQFYFGINQLLQEANFSLLYCIIEKDKLVQQYGMQSEDPYLFSFEQLLNSILRITWGWTCSLYPEKRSHVEDIKLETMLLKLKSMGTTYYTGSEVQDRIEEFRFMRKEYNESWSQIADLVATPIGRHHLGKKAKPWNEVDYEILINKITARWITIFP